LYDFRRNLEYDSIWGCQRYSSHSSQDLTSYSSFGCCIPHELDQFQHLQVNRGSLQDTIHEQIGSTKYLLLNDSLDASHPIISQPSWKWWTLRGEGEVLLLIALHCCLSTAGKKIANC
jgi:hypothetical protein